MNRPRTANGDDTGGASENGRRSACGVGWRRTRRQVDSWNVRNRDCRNVRFENWRYKCGRCSDQPRKSRADRACVRWRIAVVTSRGGSRNPCGVTNMADIVRISCLLCPEDAQCAKNGDQQMVTRTSHSLRSPWRESTACHPALPIRPKPNKATSFSSEQVAHTVVILP